MNDVHENVATSNVDNDFGYHIISEENKIRNEDLYTISKTTYWVGIKVSDGFREEINVVLP